TFESNKQYIITEDLNLLGASKIEPDCFINLIPGRNIKFHGSLDTESGYLPGSYWRISSSFGIDSATPAIVGQGDYMGSVNLLYAESNISHGIVTNTDFGLSIQAPQVSVTDISISNVNYGIYALQTTFVMQNVNISGASRYGLSVQNTLATESISITNCIVAHCEDGLSVSGGTFSISNIFLYDCYAAFRPWENTGTIEHCDFDLCYYDIYQYRASCTILYNNFFYNKKLGIFPRNYGLVNYNNFYYTALSYIDIRGLSLSQDLDAKNNYWAVSNLDQYLFDALDNDEFPDEPPCNRYIIYLPKRNSRVITAGIQ
ncbi:MAG: hypothetical protein RBS43_01210, partial [Candidatus Cloacimonas sp.]|nr:hypothetical protein [Candidatus Cloacimonas sp.]